MRIFVIGASHTGKTPFARRVSQALGLRSVSAGAWVRAAFPEPRPADDATADERAAHVARLTAFALAELQRDPGVSFAGLRAALGPDEPAVIEGMRNPYDFVHAFDPRTDRVVVLAMGESLTAFERGIDVIRGYVTWLVDNQLLDASRVHDVRFEAYGAIGDPQPGTLEHAIVDFIAMVPPPVQEAPVVRSRVHAEVPRFATHVRAEFLHDLNPAYVGQTRPCTVFSLSSYVGQAPTFQILLEDGAVFSYVPPHALVDPPGADPVLELADLAYHDCKHLEISVHVAEALRGPVLAYFKRRDLWLAGTYRFTVDWYTGNEMLHCLALANGQTALLPSHKVKFGDHAPGFAPYKKLRRDWVVGG